MKEQPHPFSRMREVRRIVLRQDPEYQHRYRSLAWAITDYAPQLPRGLIVEIGAIAHTQGTLADFLPHSLSERVLNLNQDEQLPPAHQGISADARSLPFGDNTIACVAHTDVLEHVEPEERAGFIRETSRVVVPGGLMVVAFPTAPLDKADRWLNDEYRERYSEPHPYLEEHLKNGLPDIDEVTTHLQENGMSIHSVSAGINLEVWRQSHTAYTLQRGGSFSKAFTHALAHYQHTRGALNRKPSYRHMIVAVKDRPSDDTI